jgi:YD repeat-containing protein
VLGALQLQQEASPLPNGAIAYAYDALGRLSSRSVASSGAEAFRYDAIGRLISHASDLGSFSLSYLGQTSQITQRQLPPVTSNLATSFSYLPNSGDRRLASIGNVGLSTSQYSNYSYTMTPENFITAIAETSDASAVYPGAGTQTASYNNLNQLTNLSGQALPGRAAPRPRRRQVRCDYRPAYWRDVPARRSDDRAGSPAPCPS